MCLCYAVVSDKSRGNGEAGSLVEPQRGNEKNKQRLPVPLWPEISSTDTSYNDHLHEADEHHVINLNKFSTLETKASNFAILLARCILNIAKYSEKVSFTVLNDI
ncbi:hypothetical protein XENOCAPTIV_019245 [Xenoophorus captivus]|uniref:Uncharacterized protein n=1 Tax=Xenoophorus captivus TaxID=1517983 RepID=A0ABV0Q5G3_9TELE